MSHDNPLRHPEVQVASGRGYLLTFLVSTLLMGVALFLVTSHSVAPFGLMLALSLCAGLAVIVQIYFLMHMDLSEAQIWNTFALVLTIPLFILAIGLTAWMFHELYNRTMVMMPAVHNMPGMLH
ncbi:MAG: cytochrome o ubiquinol oxidase subunit IV [Acidithiobacillus sp.]